MLRPLKTTLISHFYNEEFLLPYWLDHHTRLFDNGVMINYRSTDRSVEIIRDMAPHWTIVDTHNDAFRCADIDIEVMNIEETITGWKMCLNTTEFLFTDDIKTKLLHIEKRGFSIAKFRGYDVLDDETIDLPFKYHRPLVLQRFFGIPSTWQRNRIIHKRKNGNYHLGRHFTKIEDTEKVPYIGMGVLLHYDYSPYSDQIHRKLKMAQVVPPDDRERGYGFQHWKQFNETEIHAEYMRRKPHGVNLLTHNEVHPAGTSAVGPIMVSTLNDLQAMYKRDPMAYNIRVTGSTPRREQSAP